MTARLRHIVLATDDLAADVARAREGFGLAAGIADAAAMREFVELDGVAVSFVPVAGGRPGLRSVDVTVPPDGEPGALEVAGVVFRRYQAAASGSAA